jgi:hypothetical protein
MVLDHSLKRMVIIELTHVLMYYMQMQVDRDYDPILFGVRLCKCNTQTAAYLPQCD